MATDLKALEKRALELMKLADFGPDAVRVNTEILEQSPAHESAWTRLGRCHLEQRNFDEAVSALRSALALNPKNGVATNLLAEVRRRRALTPTARERATTGFSAREFTMLETLSPDEACRALQPRFEALFDAVNASSIAARIVETRQRRGESGSKLFHANSFHSHSTGHIVAFHHGGRWEPQFNLGWFSSPPFPASCVRIGLASISPRPAGIPNAWRARNGSSRSSIDFSRRSRNRGSVSSRGGWAPTVDSFSTAITRPRSTCCRSAPSSGS